jgi:hypothetical protein
MAQVSGNEASSGAGECDFQELLVIGIRESVRDRHASYGKAISLQLGYHRVNQLKVETELRAPQNSLVLIENSVVIAHLMDSRSDSGDDATRRPQRLYHG